MRRPSATQIGNVVADIREMISQFAGMATGLGGNVEIAGDAGTLLGPVASFMSSIVDVFGRVTAWRRPADFASKVQTLAGDVNLLVSGLAGIVLTDANKDTLKTMGDSLLPVVQAVSEMMNIFQRVKYYAPLDATKLQRLFDDIELFVTTAMQTPTWHVWGEKATESLIDGMVLGLEKNKGRVEDALRGLPGFGGTAPIDVEHVYNVVQNNTFNWNGSQFYVHNEDQIRRIAQEIVDQAIAALNLRAVTNGNIFQPGV
jgi:hypothetical protein